MDALQETTDWVEALATPRDPDGLNKVALSAVRRFGFDGYYFMRYVPGCGLVQRDNRPTAWLDYYARNGLLHGDPVALRAYARPEPFSWDEAYAQESVGGSAVKSYLASRDFGLKEGFNIQLHKRGPERASFCVYSGSAKQFRDSLRAHKSTLLALASAYDIAFAGFQPAAPELPRLSSRELECLHWASRGKTNPEIGDILSISANTVSAHMASAARKLDTTTRIQTVVKAIKLQVLMP